MNEVFSKQMADGLSHDSRYPTALVRFAVELDDLGVLMRVGYWD